LTLRSDAFSFLWRGRPSPCSASIGMTGLSHPGESAFSPGSCGPRRRHPSLMSPSRGRGGVIFDRPAMRREPRCRSARVGAPRAPMNSAWVGAPRANEQRVGWGARAPINQCNATMRGRHHILLTRAPFHLHYGSVLELCGQRRARARHACTPVASRSPCSCFQFVCFCSRAPQPAPLFLFAGSPTRDFSPGPSLASLGHVEHRALSFGRQRCGSSREASTEVR
jgi:hypothetical protein